MKKEHVKKLKKLQLSKETLQVLGNSDTREVVGGVVGSYDMEPSCWSWCGGC